MTDVIIATDADNKDKPNESIDDRAAKLVVASKKESEEFYKTKFRRFQYYDRLYNRGAAKMNTPQGRANLELPLAFQQIEPFVSQLMETHLGEAPYISFQGRTEDDVESGEAITQYTQFQLEQGEFALACNSLFRNTGKYGTAVMKVTWETDVVAIETETEIEAPELDELGSPVLDEFGIPQLTSITDKGIEEDTIHDGPRFHNKSIFDFFVPANATNPDVQRLDWCIDRVWRDIDDLIQNPNYKNKKTLRKVRDGEKVPPMDHRDPKKPELKANNPDTGDQKFKGKVEVLEWWGDFKFSNASDAISEPAIIVIANIQESDPIVLRVDKNPFKYKFKPFAAANDYPVEGEFYGIGELRHIKGLIEESTALRNARLDIVNQKLNPMWLVERQSGVNIRELYNAPNKIVLTNDLNGIRNLETGGQAGPTFQEIGQIDFDIQNTTEIINPRQDVSSVGAAFGGTATGVNFLSTKSNLRLLSKARLLDMTFFRAIGMILLRYNKDFIEDEQFFRVTNNPDNPFASLPVDAFNSMVDFKPSANPEKLTRDERKQELGYLFQTLAQIEGVAPGTINWETLVPEAMKASALSHPERFVKKPGTQIFIGPDGQPVDKQGQPVEVIPVDEEGNPTAPEGANANQIPQ